MRRPLAPLTRDDLNIMVDKRLNVRALVSDTFSMFVDKWPLQILLKMASTNTTLADASHPTSLTHTAEAPVLQPPPEKKDAPPIILLTVWVKGETVATMTWYCS